LALPHRVASESARGTHRFRRIGAGASAHDRDVPVKLDRFASARKSHLGNASLTPQRIRG